MANSDDEYTNSAEIDLPVEYSDDNESLIDNSDFSDYEYLSPMVNTSEMAYKDPLQEEETKSDIAIPQVPISDLNDDTNNYKSHTPGVSKSLSRSSVVSGDVNITNTSKEDTQYTEDNDCIQVTSKCSIFLNTASGIEKSKSKESVHSTNENIIESELNDSSDMPTIKTIDDVFKELERMDVLYSLRKAINGNDELIYEFIKQVKTNNEQLYNVLTTNFFEFSRKLRSISVDDDENNTDNCSQGNLEYTNSNIENISSGKIEQTQCEHSPNENLNKDQYRVKDVANQEGEIVNSPRKSKLHLEASKHEIKENISKQKHRTSMGVIKHDERGSDANGRINRENDVIKRVKRTDNTVKRVDNERGDNKRLNVEDEPISREDGEVKIELTPAEDVIARRLSRNGFKIEYCVAAYVLSGKDEKKASKMLFSGELFN